MMMMMLETSRPVTQNKNVLRPQVSYLKLLKQTSLNVFIFLKFNKESSKSGHTSQSSKVPYQNKFVSMRYKASWS